MEQLWQHRARCAATVGATLGACSAAGARASQRSQANGAKPMTPRQWQGGPIA